MDKNQGPPSVKQLGPLEQRLLQDMWGRGNATVRELLQDGDYKIAYTTVMTTLDRLFKKSLLDRVPEGRAFRYTPRYTQGRLRGRRSSSCSTRVRRLPCRFPTW